MPYGDDNIRQGPILSVEGLPKGQKECGGKARRQSRITVQSGHQGSFREPDLNRGQPRQRGGSLLRGTCDCRVWWRRRRRGKRKQGKYWTLKVMEGNGVAACKQWRLPTQTFGIPALARRLCKPVLNRDSAGTGRQGDVMKEDLEWETVKAAY